MNLRVVIPARMASTRLPGKPLRDIGGKSMLHYLFDRLSQANVDSLLIATDSDEIVAAAQAFGADVCLTSTHHRSGSERIAEAVMQRGYDDNDIVVNVQCDEPLLPVALIGQVGMALQTRPEAAMATLSEPLQPGDILTDPHLVKVVSDAEGYALYFSRAPIPWYRDGFAQSPQQMPADFVYHRHIGLYSYRVGFLKRYLDLAPSPLEQIEALEQLRVLYHGEKIHVVPALALPGPGVDTEEDLQRLRKLIAQQEGE